MRDMCYALPYQGPCSSPILQLPSSFGGVLQVTEARFQQYQLGPVLVLQPRLDIGLQLNEQSYCPKEYTHNEQNMFSHSSPPTTSFMS